MEYMNYLTDEELLALIEVSEEQGLLSAPAQVRENVLTLAARPAVRKSSRQRQFAAYCIRVGLAMAACLALIFGALPAPEATAPQPPQLTAYNEPSRFSQFTELMEQGFADMGDRLGRFHFEIDLFGGNHE